MATLTIRNLPDEVHAALRVRAAKHGRSMEEEVRQALGDLVEGESALGRQTRADQAAEEIRAMLRAANNGVLPIGMVDDLLAERRAEAAREEAEADAQIAAFHARQGVKA